MRIITKRGYDFGEVSSATQKAIRRAGTRLAGYWALELWHSGFGNYVWKRLLTVSAEDMWSQSIHPRRGNRRANQPENAQSGPSETAAPKP